MEILGGVLGWILGGLFGLWFAGVMKPADLSPGAAQFGTFVSGVIFAIIFSIWLPSQPWWPFKTKPQKLK